MSLSALALVLIAAFVHAWWNLLVKRTGASGLVFIWGVTLVSTLGFAVPVLLLWPDWLDALTAPIGIAILVSAALHVLYFRVLQYGYAVGDLSVVYPVARGVGPLLSAIAAMIWLGEAASVASITGLVAIVLGTFTIAGGWAMLRRRPSPAVRAGLAWGALTGVMIAGYTVNDGRAVRALGAHPVVYYWLITAVQTLVLTPWVVSRLPAAVAQLRSIWMTTLAVGLLSSLGYMLVLQAMRWAPVSMVAPARELSMLIAAFLGARLLGEGQLRRRMAGAALIALGVACLALAEP